jgi:hypothetical protein
VATQVAGRLSAHTHSDGWPLAFSRKGKQNPTQTRQHAIQNPRLDVSQATMHTAAPANQYMAAVSARSTDEEGLAAPAPVLLPRAAGSKRARNL